MVGAEAASHGAAEEKAAMRKSWAELGALKQKQMEAEEELFSSQVEEMTAG